MAETQAIQTQDSISQALNAALKRAEEAEQDNPLVYDVDSARLVIFSDQHKGNRDGADDFQVCEKAYNAALAYYFREGYTLIVLGDAEELWEERPKTVINAYPHTLALEGKFHQAGRYIRIWGNHDDNWQYPDQVQKWLAPALGGDPLQVQEQALIRIREGETELGRLFLIHGHQGTFESDFIAPLSEFFVRYFWRPFQRLFKISLNTPANDFQLRYAHDSAMYFWSEAQHKTVLIAGHTHRPVFKSESHEAKIRKSIEKIEKQLQKDPDNPELRKKAAELAAHLEWVLVVNGQNQGELPVIELKKPSYFNTGCCAFRDGDVTGIEIRDGEIRLIHWPDDENLPRPKVLAHTDLRAVFDAC